MARSRRPDWGPRFIESYRGSGNVRLSASSAGIDRDTAYKRRRREPRFAQAWAQAEQARTASSSPATCPLCRAASMMPVSHARGGQYRP